MSRNAAFALALAVAASGVVLAACSGPHPAVVEGDATSVEVRYAGDVGTTLPLAKEYCARYERVPRLVDPGLDIAIYDCATR